MKNVDDIYPLTPMQEFMLLHAVARSGPDVLVDQLCFEIRQALDVDRYRGAWQSLLDRHPALRSAFVWEEIKRPVQIVRSQLDVPFTVLDWSDEPAPEEALAALRARDRAEGLELARAPLMRITLARLAPERYYLLWTSHHLLLDRWCIGTVFEEVGAHYAAALRGETAPLAPAPAFRDYVQWIARQDPHDAQTHWRSELAGLRRGTRTTRRASGASARAAPARRLDPELRERLVAAAGAHGATLVTALQCAWALALGALTASRDVTFGLTVSGRPADLAGVEGMLGCFISNVPARLRLAPDLGLAALLSGRQASQLRQRPFEHVSPATLAGWSELEDGAALFDHLLVWLSRGENAPGGAIRMSPMPGGADTAYPLTLSVAERDDTLEIGLDVQAGFEPVAPPEAMLDALIGALGDVADAAPGAVLADLPVHRAASAAEPPPPVPAVGPARSVPRTRDAVPVGGGRQRSGLDVLEEMVRAHWEEVLGEPPPAPDASFFESGGTSLAAAALHARIEAGTRQRIPLLSLFLDPTAAGMARTLAEGDWPLRDGYHVALRAAGSRQPLYCIASPEVETIGFVLMTRHLHPEQPVHLLQAPPDADRVRRLTPYELPALGERYADALVELQPRGPFHLLGTCTGAQIALEMARTLHRRGLEVGYLGVVHTWAFYTVSRHYRLRRLAKLARYYRRRVRSVLRLPLREQAAELARVAGRRGHAPAQARAQALPAAAEAGVAPPGVDADVPLAGDAAEVSRLWFEEFGDARNDPGEPRYPGRLTVLRNPPHPWWAPRDQELWRVRDLAMGWGRQAEEVDVELLPIPRHHLVFRHPHVQATAERVQAGLDEWQGASR